MSNTRIMALCTVCFLIGFFVSSYTQIGLKEGIDTTTSKQTGNTLELQNRELRDLAEENSINIQNVASSSLSENLTEKISRLNEIIVKKELRLADIIEEITLKEQAALLEVENKISEKDKTVSKKEAEKYLPKPFSGVLAGNKNKHFMRDFNKLNDEPVDYDWGYRMELHIKDFVIIHQFSEYINLESVVCKTSICEIRGFEAKDKTWNYVMNDMQLQEWWEFTNTSSTNNHSEEFGQYFYVLTSGLRGLNL